MVRSCAAIASVGIASWLSILSPTAAADTPASIISDQILKQGYSCDEPRQAERDPQASRPNETVWILNCSNTTYRVTLIPDMAARVEPLK
jgi:hypothetical protein